MLARSINVLEDVIVKDLLIKCIDYFLN